MTDNDIIKALELQPYCNPRKGQCDKCPYLIGGNDCATRFPQDALNLINHQRAEIERLVQEKDNLIKTYKECMTEAITEFAERLCEGRVSNDPVVIAVKVELEMMKEGANNA